MKLLIEGREANPDERIRSAVSLQKSAVASGWVTKIGFSQFQEDDRTFKSGAKAGQTVEGKVVDNVWLQGVREGQVFTAVWHNNKLDHCLHNNRIVSVADLRELFKGVSLLEYSDNVSVSEYSDNV